MNLKKMPKPILIKNEKWCDHYLVTYPVSYQYNGGIIIDDKHYDGYEVPEPDVPEGYVLNDISVGLQLNSHPPIATKYLKPLPYHNFYKCCGKEYESFGKINQKCRCKICSQANEPLESLRIDLKKHDVVVVISEDVEYISSPSHSAKDIFEELPVGTEGAIIHDVTLEGCYVEFPYINEKHPHADCVIWVNFNEIKKKEPVC